MSYADDLLSLAQAEPLLDTEAERRRSVSTAYYAVFHLLVEAALSALIPPGNDPARNLARRAPTHTFLKQSCSALVPKGRSRPPVECPKQWKEAGLDGHVDREITALAEKIVALHSGRERADYDLGVVFPALDAEVLTEKATEIFGAVRAGPPEPQWTLFLTSLLVGQRRS